MLKKIIFFVLLLWISYVVVDYAKSAGPPPYNTGAQGEATCNQATCHDGVGSTPNTSTGKLLFDFGNKDSGYAPGKTYQLKITMTQKGYKLFGFQILVLRKSTGKYSGDFVITDTVRTQKRNATWGCCQERRWVEHKFKGIKPTSADTGMWTMDWKAPATNEGDVVFYVAALAADGDLTDTFDKTYTLKKTIPFRVTGMENNEASITTLENVIVDKNANAIQLFFSNVIEHNFMATIYSLDGKLIDKKSILPNGNKAVISSQSQLKSGIYILIINGNGFSLAKKIILL
ncbi:MAG: T9SS type A sorting domain-containing protein [Bacteroidetes bacterium]|nr:T9SS type A sorting domain-containing protein [Bacteroidota bacterium]